MEVSSILDKTGFKRKTYQELKSDMEEKFKEGFGADINLSARSPLGILLMIFAWFLSLVWELAERVYNSAFVSKATGVQLDRLGPYIGVSRNGATRAYGEVQIKGTPGHVIEAGDQFKTAKEVIFDLTDNVEIGSDGYGIGPVECTVAGEIGNVGVNEITVIVNPSDKVESVTNTEATAGGEEEETDAEFRARYFQSSSQGTSLLDSILSVPGVRYALVNENVYPVEQNGIPPHAIAPFVFGGNDQEIAAVILKKKPGGIQSYGTTNIDVLDSQGLTHTVGFSRPNFVDVYVKILVTPGAKFPSNGKSILQQTILDYMNSLSIGDDVILSKLIRITSSVEGIDDLEITLSTNGVDYSVRNIDISTDSVVRTDANKVVVS
ncbi:baseplate J/gp47 family protein [Priestia aryabhattai]|uniref:Baseplate J/gp47 family protein n=1 Tax=Priestia aryabhattai TaxID=412384 RepID=A0ABD7X3A3_PRIAR|nr:baseplate J/gp47 family protein [Priestia aryabhattai]WEA46802.1 baseplate J/gp47 family protein [Priestia aryabhattai]